MATKIQKIEEAVLGGGCFWCLEAIYKKVKGVIDVVPGYAGGHVENPTYEQVKTGTTGHAEVVKITFNPAEISYEKILDIFFEIHDPTTPNRQGNDIGSQYRSIILYKNEKQKQIAKTKISELQQCKKFDRPIITQVIELDYFYEAEKYHHNYFEKHPDQPYCKNVISPKLEKFLKNFKFYVVTT